MIRTYQVNALDDDGILVPVGWIEHDDHAGIADWTPNKEFAYGRIGASCIGEREAGAIVPACSLCGEDAILEAEHETNLCARCLWEEFNGELPEAFCRDCHTAWSEDDVSEDVGCPDCRAQDDPIPTEYTSLRGVTE